MIVLLTAIILTTMKLLTRLCFDLSQLGEHKFKHSFQDCRNAIFNRGNEVETTTHYLLHYPSYANERRTYWTEVRNIDTSILE